MFGDNQSWSLFLCIWFATDQLIFPGRQTVNRLKSFIDSKPHFLNDIQPDLATSRVEEHVIRNAGKTKGERLGNEAKKIEVLRLRIKQEKTTLFFIIHDEAHYAPVKHNLTDRLINSLDVITAKNVVLLQVSATPYCLLTQNSRLFKTPKKLSTLNWLE